VTTQEASAPVSTPENDTTNEFPVDDAVDTVAESVDIEESVVEESEAADAELAAAAEPQIVRDVERGSASEEQRRAERDR